MLLLLKAVFALAATLGLFGIGVYIARRWGPMRLFGSKVPSANRMAVVQSLALGANHRLVLVRVDGGERLVLLGEGRIAPAEAGR